MRARLGWLMLDHQASHAPIIMTAPPTRVKTWPMLIASTGIPATCASHNRLEHPGETHSGGRARDDDCDNEVYFENHFRG